MKKIRKGIALLLTVLLLAGLLPVSALAENGAQITVGTAEGQAGETVTLNVDISSNPGFCYAGFDLVKDENAPLTLTAITKGETFATATLTPNVPDGRFSVDNSTGDLTANGTLVSLSFAIAENAAAGEYPVTLKVLSNDPGNFSNYDEEDVPVSITAGSITVSAPAHTHTLTAHEAVEPTTAAPGNTAYWSCECGKFFSDENGENEIEENSWVIPAIEAHECVDADHDHRCDICEAVYNRAPVLAEGVTDVTAYVVTGEAYLLRDLQAGRIFTDPDGDALFLKESGPNGSTSTSYYFQRSTDNGVSWGAEQDFASALFGMTTISLTETQDGTYLYRVYAKDSYGGNSADEGVYWNLTLTFLPADQIPFDISFYLSKDYNYATNGNRYPIIRLWKSDGHSNKLGDEIALTTGETENSYGRMNVTVNGGWYVYEGYSYNTATGAYDIPLGGMQLRLPTDSNVDGNAAGGTNIYLGEVDFYTTSKKTDNTAFTAADYTVRVTCPIMQCDAVTGTPYVSGSYTKYPTLLYTGGNACLYNYYMLPTDTEHYAVTQAVNYAINKSTSVQNKTGTVNASLLFTATVPASADFAVYFQYNNFNTTEIAPVDAGTVDGDTKTLRFRVPNSDNITWRMTDPNGVYVTKAGWISKNGIANPISLTFEGSSTDKNSHSFGRQGTVTVNRDEADLQVFVSSTGAKAIGSSTERFRAYRMWELINSDTANIMIEPDYVWTKISGPASISYAEDAENTDIHGGNSYHNWADINANGGTSIFAVHYKAIDLDTSNNTSHAGFYPATNPDRTAFAVIADSLGSAAADIPFNGDFDSNSRGHRWDYIYDTWYFLDTEENPTLDFTANGAVSVEYAFGVTTNAMRSSVSSFTKITPDGNGSYSVPLAMLNKAAYNYGGTVILRMKDAAGLYSYQLVHASRMSVTVENASFPNEPVMPGNTVKLHFDGLYRSVNKIAGIFNPTTFYLRYTADGQEVNGTTPQYQQMDRSTINLVIPENIEFEENATETTYTFTNGYVYGSMYSAANPFSAMYYMTDVGVGTNFNAVTVSFAFQRLADIPVVINRAAETAVTLNIVGGENPSVSVKNASGEAVTAQDGVYSLPYGDFSYEITAEGYKKTSGTFTVGSSDNGTKTVTVTLTALDGSEWDGTNAAAPETDENGVYLIGNGAELAWFAAQVNAGTGASYNAKLTADIDLNWQLWTPIGSSGKPYKGTFDGNGHWITGLYIDSTAANQGLFGYISAATIRNLGVSGSVTSTGNAVGGIVGYGAGTIVIENCINAAKASGNQAVGGIVGRPAANTGKINNCYNVGNITASKFGGGISGCGTSVSMGAVASNCYNRGKVSSAANGGGINPGGAGKASNSWYLNDSYVNGTSAAAGTAVSSDVLKTMAATLGAAFKDDAGMINNGYPVLAWEKSEHVHNYVDGACSCGDVIPSVEDGKAEGTISGNTVVAEGKPLVINAVTGEAVTAASVTIPAPVVENIAKASNATIKTDVGTMAFDQNALSRIAANADGSVQIFISVAPASAELQGTDENALLVTVTAKCGDKEVFSGTGMGSAEVTVPYAGTVAEGEQLNVYYVSGSKRIRVPAALADGQITFTVSHFSDYLVSKQGSDSGYTVAADSDKTVTPGETVSFAVTVGNGDENVTAFNAYQFTVTYDASKLTYTGINVTENVNVTDSDPKGTIRIAGYGANRSFSDKIALSFTADAVGVSDITIVSAKIDAAENAITDNAPEAQIIGNITTVTVSNYTVTLPAGFTGEKTAAAGSDYTFAADDTNYTYVLSGTMGDSEAQITDNGDGTFTVSGISGNVTINEVSRLGKSFNVTLDGSGKDAVTADDTATYGTDYTFSVDEEPLYDYTVTVTIGGTAYTGLTVSGSDYTIPGSALTGPVTIGVTKTYAGPSGNLTVTVYGDTDHEINAAPTATEGQNYSFTLTRAEGFTYTLTVSIGGSEYDVTPVEAENVLTYTIPGKDVNAGIKISLTKEANVTVDVTEYIKLTDSESIFLVTAKADAALPAGRTIGFSGSAMYTSEKYENAYAWLVISSESIDSVRTDAVSKIGTIDGTSAAVNYNGDVNETGLVDVNDAQLVYNMYNARYDSFDSVSIAKFLAADLTGDKLVNVSDAAAVVAAVLAG